MLIKVVLLLFATTTVVSSFNTAWDSVWDEYKKNFNRMYDDTENNAKRSIYERNYGSILDHNKMFDNGTFPYKMSLNMFTDMSSEEMLENLYGFSSEEEGDDEDALGYSAPDDYSAPAEVDWRDEGYVTRVKNQGRCKSCWAYSAIGALEGQYKRKHGKLVELSEQNIVDCLDNDKGKDGCSSGTMKLAYSYIRKNGIEPEKHYPSEGTRGKCQFNPDDSITSIKTYTNLPKGDEEALRKALASVGPISIGIDAGHRSFQHYGSGIYEESACSSSKLNHAVLLVGYGTENGRDYWILKNSWGRSWGIHGYMKIVRNKNMCGIATKASYPVL